jgi:hypothetical protein
MMNPDAKIFTKIMSQRIARFLPRIINPYQTAFIPGRLIANNGWAVQSLMTHARATDPNGSNIGILLDQKKADDRVHPTYLKEVLTGFGFPILLSMPSADCFLYKCPCIDQWISWQFFYPTTWFTTRRRAIAAYI